MTTWKEGRGGWFIQLHEKTNLCLIVRTEPAEEGFEPVWGWFASVLAGYPHIQSGIAYGNDLPNMEAAQLAAEKWAEEFADSIAFALNGLRNARKTKEYSKKIQAAPLHPKYGRALTTKPQTVEGVTFHVYRSGINRHVWISDDHRAEIHHSGPWRIDFVDGKVADRKTKSLTTAMERAVERMKK